MVDSCIKINELLIRVFNDILKIEENALKKGIFSDISITEVHTIEAIGMYIPVGMSELAKNLNITLGTLTVAINNLLKKGYVNRARCEDDRRIVKISLTKKGRLMYRVHKKFHFDMVMSATSSLNEEEEYILIEALTKLDKFFSKEKLC